MTITLKSMLTAASIVSLVTIAATSAHAAEWRLSTSYQSDSEAHEGSLRFAELVKEKSDGRIEIQVFPANQLGDWTEVYEQVTSGAVQMTMGAVPSTFDARLAIDSFPYAVADYEEAAKAYAPGGYMYDIVSSIVADQGVQVLSTWALGMGGGAFTKELPEPTNPDAQQGLKVRVWPGGVTHRALMEDFGFTVTMIPWDEVYTALQTGVADGVIGGNPELTVTHFMDITKMYVQYNDHFENHYIMINKELFDGLSEEDKSAVQEAAVEVMNERFPVAEASDEAYMQQLRDAGVKVVTFDEDTMQAFASAARQDVWPKIKDEIGEELYARLKAELGM
ncbi:TRAP transporter substrate-binding protein DctP [Pseudohoeflea coraliihabitans]|uniref:TRAP transporter substrate-binding protein DctP n=1 Tax=Pseudohoeflea coraliihabitans TaxID=2860393 RepID=A0ABS6WK68_9HYPH|nr:TRAP transporter substrate-binding protein DctP [Pseudohoeflea sp. DP4N28-3]MBW3096265.1 TRAP transporter substrate-binding protein DctP [Pseudohoeflea sp. DP4N28-3]